MEVLVSTVVLGLGLGSTRDGFTMIFVFGLAREASYIIPKENLFIHSGLKLGK